MPEGVAARSGADVVPGWPRWLSRLVGAVQGLVMAAGVFIMFVGSGTLVDEWSDMRFLPAIPGVVIGWIVVVTIHEAGHFIVARRSGMTPYCVAAVGVYAWASSNGWRVRLTRLPGGVGGFVISHFDADRPFRRQMVPMLVAGPAANLLAALLLGAAGAWLLPDPVAVYVGALALLNACVGVANLLPVRNRFLDSDGLLLLHWLRGNYERAPEMLMHRLNALSLKGITVDKYPVEWIEGLREAPVLGPALRHWFRLCACQNAGAWSDIADIGREFEADIEALPPDAAKALSVFIRQMRTEIAFSQAMASGCGNCAISVHIDALLDWFFPALRPRCRALEAALRGDEAGMNAFLVDSERKMRKTHDLGYKRSEEIIRRSIMAMANRRGAGSARNCASEVPQSSWHASRSGG